MQSKGILSMMPMEIALKRSGTVVEIEVGTESAIGDTETGARGHDQGVLKGVVIISETETVSDLGRGLEVERDGIETGNELGHDPEVRREIESIVGTKAKIVGDPVRHQKEDPGPHTGTDTHVGVGVGARVGAGAGAPALGGGATTVKIVVLCVHILLHKLNPLLLVHSNMQLFKN